MSVRRPGFTLVEVIITIVLLGIGILAVIGSVTTMSRFQNFTSLQSEMADLAHSKLDELRAFNINSNGTDVRVTPTGSTGGSLTTNVTNFADSLTGPSGVSYRQRWFVEATGSDIPAATRRVTILIQPRLLRTSARYQVSTLFYVPPPI